uniref:Uncharacterized protein n=1 Tax=Zea mays TaxID=4577 RepID=C0HEL9_MAIZE|nr:unknown [Zea mays]
MYRHGLPRRSGRRLGPGVGRGGGEAGRDGGVVHGVVEALRLHHLHAQPPRLVLRQHAEPPGRGRGRGRPPRQRLVLGRRPRVDVVRLPGPPQQRRPPLGAVADGARPRRGRASAGPGRSRRADGEDHP